MAVASNKTDCPSEELLAKFASGACDGANAAEFLAHAEQCVRCARWVADAKDTEAMLPSLRDALDAEAEDLKPGRPLDAQARDIEGYVLEEEIGRGGMGVVYRAYQKATKRQVALKVLLEGPFASAVAKRRFEREVELAAQLQHPYIVTILESGISSGRYYFAMQYVEGQRLDAYIATSKPSIKQTLQLIGKVCEAVNYAQQHGVIHRDLKPSNIIVDDDGNPHVLDFGLAKLADPSTSEHGVPSIRSLDGQLMGTLAYMSPEQATGSNQDIDIRTDVYSLGVVLFQALTGRFPYEVAGNVPGVVDNILNTEPVRPSKIRAEINDEVDTIVLKALSKEPDRRYQTAGDLGQDIARHLKGEPIEAKRNSSLYVLKKTLRRYRIPIAVTAGFVVVLTVSLAVISSLFFRAEADRNRAMDSEKEARWQAYVGNIAAAQSALATNDIVAMHRFLDVAPREFRDWEWRYLLAACDESLATLRGHTESVTSVAVDSRGKFLASGSKDGTVRIWDLSLRLELHCLEGHGESVNAVAFRSDGEFLASASDDKTVRVWDTSTWQETLVIEGHGKRVLSVTFSPDGTRLASGANDDTVRLWDSSTGKQLNMWPVKTKGNAWGSQNIVCCVAFSPDGRRLAATTWSDESVRLWDLESGKLLWRETWKDAGGLRSVAFSPDGQYLAAGSQNHGICVWTIRGEEWRILRGHTGAVRSVAFDLNSDDLRLVSASDDATIRIWSAATNEQLQVMLGHDAGAWSARFTVDGKRVVSASFDTTIRIWDSSASMEPATLGRHGDEVQALAFSEDGARLASGTSVGDRTIHIWDVCTGERVAALEREGSSSVLSVAFNPDGTRLAAGLSDKTVHVWNACTGEELLSLRGHTGHVPGVAFSPNGKYLASASYDMTVRLWEMSTGQELWSGREHEGHVVAVTFNPSGTCLASASRDGTVRLWDVASGKILGVLDKHEDQVVTVAFSPDGSRLASGSCDTTVRIWDTTTGKELRILRGRSGTVQSVAFSPDGARLATATNDAAVRVWDTRTGEDLIRLRGHEKRLHCVAFSPDGTRLASGAADWKLRLWDSVPYRIRYQEREAALAAKRGDFKMAEALFKKACNGIRDALGPDHPGTLPPLKGLIESLIAQGKFAEAQPLAVKHHECNELAYGQIHTLAVNAARLLVELYDAWGRLEEAAPWRAKLPRAGSAADLEQSRSPDSG